MTNKEKFYLKLKKLNIVLTLFIVCLHSDCSYMLTGDNEIINIFFRVLNTLYDVAVPLFFFISAYLFYQNMDLSWNIYIYKIKKRVKSLLIPYLIFSSVWMCFYAIFNKIPVLGRFVKDSALNSSVEKNIIDLLMANYDPPIWYIRTLFLIQICSPIFFYIIKKHIFIGPILYIIGILINFNYLPPYSSAQFWLPSFILGIWFASYNQVILLFQKLVKIPISLWLIVIFVTVVVFSTVDKSMNIYYSYRNMGSLLFLFFFCCVDFKVNVDKYSPYTFFVFLTHYPIAQMIKRVLNCFGGSDITIIGIYLLTIIITLTICVGSGNVLKKIFPRMWKLLTGDR